MMVGYMIRIWLEGNTIKGKAQNARWHLRDD